MLRLIMQIVRCKDVGPFRMEFSGRCGKLVYTCEERSLDIGREMPGVSRLDILLGPLNLNQWTTPEGLAISESEQIKILHSLRQWLNYKWLRSNIDLPKNQLLSDAICSSAGCSKKTYEGFASCPEHYDLNLLIRE